MAKAFATKAALPSLAQMCRLVVGVKSAQARILLATGLAREFARPVRGLEMFFERSLFGEESAAEWALFAFVDALVNALVVVVETSPREIGGIAKMTLVSQTLVQRSFVVIQGRIIDVLFPAYLQSKEKQGRLP